MSVSSWSIRRLNLGDVERSFVHVNAAAWPPDERSNRMVTVSRVETAEDDVPLVSLVVSVGIDQMNQVRLLSNVSAAVSDFKTSRQMQLVSKDRLLVRFPVAIGVFENEQFVVRFVRRLVLRIARHRRDPESAFRIERKIDGVFEIRKLNFRSKQIDFVAFRDGELPDGFFRRKNFDRIPEVRRDVVQLTSPAVVNRPGHRLSLSGRPDSLVDNGAHFIEFASFVFEDVLIGERRVPVVSPRTSAVNVETVDRSVTMKVLKILLRDFGHQLLRNSRLWRGLAESSFRKRRREDFVSSSAEMDPVERERSFVGSVKFKT